MLAATQPGERIVTLEVNAVTWFLPKSWPRICTWRPGGAQCQLDGCALRAWLRKSAPAGSALVFIRIERYPPQSTGKGILLGRQL